MAACFRRDFKGSQDFLSVVLDSVGGVLLDVRVTIMASISDGVHLAWDFFRSGGVFMWLILACSVVGLAVAIYKFLALHRCRIIPADLEKVIENGRDFFGALNDEGLQKKVREGNSVLARLCREAWKQARIGRSGVRELVRIKGREEIVAMGAGLPGLDVVITIAPLLGLLGTASGLVLVFADFGVVQEGAQEKMAQGIAMALNTTIGGLAVAVPAVIAHTYFSRKVEKLSARLEVLMGKVVRSLPEKGENARV